MIHSLNFNGIVWECMVCKTWHEDLNVVAGGKCPGVEVKAKEEGDE